MLSHTLTAVPPHRLLSAICALSVFVALFVETGLLVGLVMPADSLLFAAGLLCATPTSTVAGERPSLTAVLIAAMAGASLGAQTGYLRGAHALRGLLADPGQPHLRPLVAHTRRVLERHGTTRAVALTRFVPVVRTVVNPLAAATGISPRRFAASQVVGTVVWTTGLVFAGDLLGTTVPSVEDHVGVLITVLVVLSAVPGLLENRRVRVAEAELERDLLR